MIKSRYINFVGGTRCSQSKKALDEDIQELKDIESKIIHDKRDAKIIKKNIQTLKKLIKKNCK